MNNELTQERLQELLEYNADTGVFTFRLSRGNMRMGSTAGCVRKNGYVKIVVDNRDYQAHRLAFLAMTGSFPVGQVDHRNGVRNDNRWQNLRDVSGAENGRNRGLASNNASGYQGVSWIKRDQRWQASIEDGGKRRSLGLYRTPEDAHAAYARAAAVLGFSGRHIYGANAEAM